MTFPAEGQIKKIFGAMVNSHLSTFDDEVKPLGDPMTAATLEIYLSCASRDGMLRLWVHECSRAFSDRFTNTADKGFFSALLDEKLGASFQGASLKNLYKD